MEISIMRPSCELPPIKLMLPRAACYGTVTVRLKLMHRAGRSRPLLQSIPELNRLDYANIAVNCSRLGTFG